MKIVASETLEQKFRENKPAKPNTFVKSVEDLRFKLNETYFLFVLPKVISINLEQDSCQIDYPFEKLSTHFGVYSFMHETCNMKSHRVNCVSECPICQWMSENRKLPLEVFKIGVATNFFLTYAISNKKVKIAWFPDYLHAAYEHKLGVLMNEKRIGLIDALRYKIKVYTGDRGKNPLEIEIDPEVQIPSDNAGFDQLLKKICDKPLVDVIQREHKTSLNELNTISSALRSYSERLISEEAFKKREEKLEERTEEFDKIIEGFSQENKSKMETSSNSPITDSNEDLPF
jgi:hypothetical protein